MKVYIITYRGQPATLEKLEDLEMAAGNRALRGFDPVQRPTLVAASTARACRQRYNDLFGGYTWPERPKGVGVVGLNSGELYS